MFMKMKSKSSLKLQKAYRKSYRLTIAAPGKNSFKVTFPAEVVEREARMRGLTIKQFLSNFYAVAHYNNFDGVRYTFEEMPK
jgi:hypothetical protein